MVVFPAAGCSLRPMKGCATILSRSRTMPSDAAKHYTELTEDVRAFRHYIQAERGMAANTVLAYGRDLDRFALWVTGGGLADYLKPTVRELSHYLAHLRDEQLAPSSVARHLVA